MAEREHCSSRAKLFSKLDILLGSSASTTKKPAGFGSTNRRCSDFVDSSCSTPPAERLTCISDQFVTPISNSVCQSNSACPLHHQTTITPTHSTSNKHQSSRIGLLRKLDHLLDLYDDGRSVSRNRTESRPRKREVSTFNVENQASKRRKLPPRVTMITDRQDQVGRDSQNPPPAHDPEDPKRMQDEQARSAVIDHLYTSKCRDQMLTVGSSLDRTEAFNLRLTELLDKQRSELETTKATVESLQSHCREQNDIIIALRVDLKQSKSKVVVLSATDACPTREISNALEIAPHLEKIGDLEAQCHRQEKVIATLTEELKHSKNFFMATFKSGATGVHIDDEVDDIVSCHKKIDDLQFRLREKDMEIRELSKLVKNQNGRETTSGRVSLPKSPVPAVVVEQESFVPELELVDKTECVLPKIASREVEMVDDRSTNFNNSTSSQNTDVAPTRRSVRQRKANSKFS